MATGERHGHRRASLMASSCQRAAAGPSCVVPVQRDARPFSTKAKIRTISGAGSSNAQIMKAFFYHILMKYILTTIITSAQVDDFVEGVQEELGVLNELRYEWRRLQTFVNWPHTLPRPAELAKAGFYFCPSEDAPDRQEVDVELSLNNTS